jgi:hypothetical protein
MLRIFIGYDHRQPISYNVLQFSIMRRSSKPVAITPLCLPTLPLQRQGLTPFTFSRFLTPYLCGYEGWALFLDIDMLCLADVADLFALADPNCAAMVSKNDKRFEWASLILFNCAHPDNRRLTPEAIETGRGLHGIEWTANVGSLPGEWNHLVGYDAPRPDAKIVHFTQGMPIYPETEGSEYAEQWHAEATAGGSAAPWLDLMGRSIHAAPSRDRSRLVAKLHADADYAHA